VDAHATQTVLLAAGLPYSGKTAIIERLLQRLPGEAVYIDAIFRDFVAEEDVSLQRWLAEGSHLVDRIIEAIESCAQPRIYVEIGILQPAHRDRLMRWIRSGGYRLVPVLLECGSKEAVRERQAKRALSLASQPDRLKIAIGIEELDGPISAAFERPGGDEGFLSLDTSGAIDDSVEAICRRIAP